MSEPIGPGMGRPSGPGFAGPSSDSPSPGSLPSFSVDPPSTGRRTPTGPPRRRLPTVLTFVAIGVVALIVAVATVIAARDDVRLATPRPVPSRVAASPIPTDRIEFTTGSGSGVLEIVRHGWNSDGTDLDNPGPLLTIEIKVSCQSGTLRYGPDSFQAFDRNGELFDPEALPDSPGALASGILSAGQRVSGTVAFDIPRGGVTLLMSDESSQTVTALKVPD